MKIRTRLLILFCILINTSGAFAQTASNAFSDAVTSFWGKDGILQNEDPNNEQKELRTDMSKVFNYGDTSYIYFGEWHYEAEDGTFQDIDLAFKASEFSDYELENKTNRFQSYFGSAGAKASKNGSDLFFHENPTLTINGKSQSAVSITPNSTSNIVKYSNQFNDVDYQYQIGASSVKHVTVFKSPSTFNGATGNIITSEEVEIPVGYSLQDDNGNSIADGVVSGNIRVTNGSNYYCGFLQPRVWDNTFDNNPLEIKDTIPNVSSNAILLNYKVKSLGDNRYQISTILPADWATSINRVFPLVLDPTVTFNSSFSFLTGAYQYPWRADSRQKYNQVLIRSTYLTGITSSYEITDVAYYKNSNHTYSNTGVTIKMGTTSTNNASITPFTPSHNCNSSSTLNFTSGSNGWKDISFSSPYNYTYSSNNNLIVEARFVNGSSSYSSSASGNFLAYETNSSYEPSNRGRCNCTSTSSYPSSRFYGDEFPYLRITYATISTSPNLTYVSSQNSLSVSGSTINLGLRVTNSGSSTASSSRVGYYLSANSTITTSDYYIGDDFVSSLTAGSYSNESEIISIPSSVPAGTYYVGYIIDYQSSVAESNENDNTYYWSTPQVTVSSGNPNLTFVSSQNSLSIAGTTLSIGMRAENNSSTNAGSARVGYYLSTNANITTSDYYLDDDNLGSINAGGISTESQTIDLSNSTYSSIPAGTYYVGYIIDYQGSVTESDETDNDFSFFSPQVTISASCGVPPGPVTTSTDTTTANLDWGSVSGYSSFQVQYKPTTSGSWINTTSSWSGINLTGLNTSTTYDWRVRTNCSGTYSPYTSVNQFTTGSCTVPIASIGASVSSPIKITEGQSINFTDQSSNNPTSWTWTFNRSSSSGKTTQNASNIVFNEPGRGWAKLQVSNSCGSHSTSVKVVVESNGDDPNPDDDKTSGQGGDPVNMATGEFTWSQKDLSLMGIGGEYSFVRNYRSQEGYNSSLGHNWMHNYNVSLDTLEDRWTVHYGDGNKTVFVSYEDGSTQPLYRGERDTMYYGTGGTFILEKPSGMKYIFTTARLLQKITDRNGNEINFAYNGFNQNTRITFPSGRFINLAYSSGKISSIADNTGRTISYLYNASNDLIHAINVFGDTTSYQYDASHRMVKVLDPKRNAVVENIYDANSRVSKQYDVYGDSTLFNYTTVLAGLHNITDAIGNTQSFYHTDYTLIEKYDELSNQQRFTYNLFNQPTLTINQDGDSTEFEYSSNGNLLKIIDALNNTTELEYDTLNLPTKVTNARGIATEMVYDSVGNLTETHYPNGGISYNTYNSQGQVLTYTDPQGRTTTFTYSTTKGDVSTITTPSGTYSFDYDNIGRVDEIFDRNNKKTTLEYDDYGNITKITDPMTYTTEYTYDEHGNLITYKDKGGTVTTYRYDLKDRLVSLKNALGDSSILEYNAIDQVTRTTDYNGNQVDFTYTKRGQLQTVTNALGKDSMVYDNRGNLIKSIDALGNTTTNELDKLNRIYKTIDPLGSVYEQQYNEVSQVIKTIDPNNNATNYEFDSLGLLSKVTDALGGTTHYTRNISGLITSLTDAKNHTTQWLYDNSNRPITMHYPNGDSTSTTYDNEGNVLTQTDANGIVTTATLNDNYEVTQLAHSNGNTYNFTVNKIGAITGMTNASGSTAIQYDTLHRPISVTDPFGNVIGYGYDANSNRTATVYPSGDSVTTIYNALNLPVMVTDWLGNSSTRQYENNGWLKEITNSNGTQAIMERNGLGRFTSYINLSGTDTINRHFLTYDNVGNILANKQLVPVLPDFNSLNINNSYDANDIQQTQGAVTYSADKNGALTGKADGTNSFVCHWIENDLMDYYTLNGDTTRNSHNPFGNRISKTTSGNQINYVLDIVSGLSQILQETNSSNQVTRSYVYGPDGLGWMIDSSGKTSFYHFDHLGNTVALSDTAGNVTDSFACDVFGAFVNHLGNIDQPFVFGGKYGIQYEGAGMYQVRARYYDADNGRFISRDAYPAGLGNTQSINRYVYGLNNPNMWMDPSGLKEQSIVGSYSREYLLKQDWFTKDRPDYDGFVSMAEGIKWARNNPNALENPTIENTLYIDAGQFRYGNLSTSDFAEVGVPEPQNLFNNTNALVSLSLLSRRLRSAVYALGRFDAVLLDKELRTIRIVNNSATDYDWNTGGSSKRNFIINIERARLGFNDSHGFKVHYYGIGILNK